MLPGDLDLFFIFHRRLGSDDEGATVQERAEKLLLFHAFGDNVENDLELQLEQISICEALINLSDSFDAGNKCDSFVTDSHRYALYECEGDIWMVLALHIPNVPSNVMDLASENPPEIKSKHASWNAKRVAWRRKTSKLNLIGNSRYGSNEGTFGDCVYGEPNVNVMRAVLKHLYEIYFFVNGSMTLLLDFDNIPKNIKLLRKMLRKTRHYQELMDDGDLVNPDQRQQDYIANRQQNENELARCLSISPAERLRSKIDIVMRLSLTQIDIRKLHLFYEIPGLQYYPVDKATYLSIQYFMRLLTSHFKAIEHTALLFHGQLMWSSLDIRDTAAMFKLLKLKLKTGKSEQTRTKPGFLELGGWNSNGRMNIRREHMKPVDSTDMYAPECYFKTDNQEKILKMNKHGQIIKRITAYHVRQATLVVILNDTKDDSEWDKRALLDLCGELETFMRIELDNLAQAIATNSRSSLQGNLSLTAGPGSFTAMRSKVQSMSVAEHETVTLMREQIALNCRFLYLNHSSFLIKASESFIFPEKHIPSKQIAQYDQLISKMAIYEQYRNRSFILGEKDMGQSLSMGLSSALNRIRSAFTTEADEIMEFLTLIPPSPLYNYSTSLFQRGNRKRENVNATDGDMNVNLCDQGCWLYALKSGSRQMYLVFDAKLTMMEAYKEVDFFRTTYLRDIVL